MNKYYYKIYGLIVESEIFIPELIELNIIDEHTEYEIDVIVKYSDMTLQIKENISRKIHCSFTKEECWFLINNVAIYRICNGNKIFVESIGGQPNIKTFLLGSAFGCLLIQRDIVAIHGGTVLINNKTVTITGESGVGKSTLTSAFSCMGYKFLADDVSAISTSSDEEILVNPAYPQQKLCRDAAINLGLKIENLVRIDEGRDKFAIPSHKNFMQEPKKLYYIVEIVVKENGINNNVTIEEIIGVDKLQAIIKNIYRGEIAKVIGIKGEYFKHIISIAKQIKYYKISRTPDLFSLQEEIKLITSQVGE